MKDLSLFLLDIAKNSVAAGAPLTCISVLERQGMVTLRVQDNGCGMAPDFLARVTDPFTTTRTTRRVGMGLPLLKMTAELAGGSFEIESQLGVGTCVTASFPAESVDTPPLGDVNASVTTLIQGSPDQDFLYCRARGQAEFTLDTRQLRELLGPEVPLDAPEVLDWITDYLRQQERVLPGA